MMIKAVLKNWSVVSNQYAAPELGVKFRGSVYGHPSFNDGDVVITTPIVRYEDGEFITRSGTYYILEGVDPEYEKEYPNAYLRIIEGMKSYTGFFERGDE